MEPLEKVNSEKGTKQMNNLKKDKSENERSEKGQN